MFNRLCRAGLQLKPTKCHLVRKITHLGIVVSDHGVAAHPQKVQAVCAFPIPPDLKHLRPFLGLASYYQRFILRFAKITSPLNSLTRKDIPSLWDSSCQQSFDNLKQCLVENTVLAFPNFQNRFMLEMDASGVALGVPLAQEQEDGSVRILAYASRSLLKHEQNYGVTEL